MRPPLPSSSDLLLVAALGLGLALLSGCSTIPEGRSAVDSVDIVNAGALDGQDVKDKLATSESPKFLGLFRGLFYDYEIFDPSMLQRDLARVERYYHGHGFLEAHARAARVIHRSNDHVRVELVVDAGSPTLDRELRIDGLEGVPQAIVQQVRTAAATALPRGTRFEEDAYATAKTAVGRALTDHGYAYATVKADARADLLAHAVDYVFTVHAGPPAVFGDVTIVQTTDPTSKESKESRDQAPQLPPEPLLRAVDIHPNEPYSTAAIDNATQALLDLEVLSSVQIVPPKPTDPPPTVVPLQVRVEPGKLHGWRLGGGFEFDEIKTELHGLVAWEDHNFFGDLRDFNVEFKPGVVLYPFRSNNPVAPTNPLPEERLRLQLKQPGFIEPHTTLFAQPEGNVFPMLVAPNPARDQPVLGYGELKETVGLERRFGGHVLVRLTHTFQSELPFAYTSLKLTQQTPNIFLSYPQLTVQLDLRDNPIRTHSGVYLANDVSVAGGLFGGSGTDLRIQPEARGYVPIVRGVTFAARATVGFLFASNYGDYVRNHLAEGVTPNSASNDRVYRAVDRDIELVYFRGFFSGGPSSNRGYPLRGIAPHGVVPFLSPATLQAQAAASKGGTLSCVPNQPGYSAEDCDIPIGGFTLWEASVEVRFDISGPLGTAVFCDAGDAAPGEAQLRLNHLNLSCGTGVRYETPVGAIRFDVAFRPDALQVLGPVSKADSEIDGPAPQPYFTYIPMSLSFGIGEAF